MCHVSPFMYYMSHVTGYMIFDGPLEQMRFQNRLFECELLVTLNGDHNIL